METTAIRKYEAQGTQLLTEAKSIMIVDDTTRELASEFTANCRKAVKAIEAEFKPDVEAAHKLHKDLLDRMKRLCEPFKQAQGVVDGEIKREWMEREKERREVERRARIEEEAERRRQEAQLAKEAAEAIDRGDMEEAEALADSQVVVQSVRPAPDVVKTTKSDAGSTTVKSDILVELVDKKVVITAVGDGKLPDTILDVNLGVAKRYAKASGLTQMQGFRISETAVVSGRTR
jgi:hypothetical protein